MGGEDFLNHLGDDELLQSSRGNSTPFLNHLGDDERLGLGSYLVLQFLNHLGDDERRIHSKVPAG
ncbi:hypothetical protein E3H47_08585 [Acinetobacter radioresistens]|nr:hypothetical protein E3H47_08585 [Acinetobacter radioresistens]